MHVIVRALLLPWIVTFAAAAGVVKLNTKADPVEAVVEVFKHLHPAATEAALAVAMNEVASVLEGLEGSDTSTENVAFEDENERRRAAAEQSERRGACSDITSREVCKNAANKADCSWSKSREKCKSKRKKCAEVKNKKTCHKKKYANICAWSLKKEKCRNAKCEEIDDERDCMSEGARKRGCKWKNNQERCIVDKDAGGGGSDAFTESTSTSAFAGASCAAQEQQIVALNANITNLSAELETKDVELETSADALETSADALAEATAGKAAAEAANATNAAALADAEATIVTKVAELAAAAAGKAAAEAANATNAAALAEATVAKETCEARICDGLFVDACAAEEYADGGLCTDCPAGHTCDGAHATKCAADKYVDANACLACPTGFTCDGVTKTGADGLWGNMTFLGVDVDTANANKPAFDTTIAGIAGVDETSIVALSFAPFSSFSFDDVTQCFLDGGDCASCCPDCDDLSYSRKQSSDNCVCYNEVLTHPADYLGLNLGGQGSCVHVTSALASFTPPDNQPRGGVFGGTGDDVIVLEGDYFSDIYGESGEDKITIIGNEAKRVYGGYGNDIITIIGDRAGYSKFDEYGINGGDGDDTIIIVGDESVSVVGGPDDDSCSIIGKGPDTCTNTDLDPNCVDLDTYFCPYWVVAGECETNPDYMFYWCAMSCGVCSGVTDAGGYPCSDYTNSGFCGKYDTDDFVSSELCCKCGGGDRAEAPPLPADCEYYNNLGVKALYDIKVEDDDEANEISGRITSADPAAVSVEGLEKVTCLSIDAPAIYATVA